MCCQYLLLDGKAVDFLVQLFSVCKTSVDLDSCWHFGLDIAAADFLVPQLQCAVCRQLLLMPDISEVATFKKGTGTGAKLAAAALVIQQAYRQHRHCALCKVRFTCFCSSLSIPLQNKSPWDAS